VLLAAFVVACTSSVKPSPSSTTATSAPASVAPSVTGSPTATTSLDPTDEPDPSPTATASPTAPPSATPTLTSSPTRGPDTTRKPEKSPTVPPSTYPEGSVIVTFKVINEKYRVLVTSPDNIAIVEALLVGDPAPSIPNGVVVRGDPSVNRGWTWHIDPDSLEFADATTEVCDGKPSYVEDEIITGDYFCPWSAQVIAIVPANR
jgi:hypothetical protein